MAGQVYTGRLKAAMTARSVPDEALNPRAKVVDSPSSHFSFGVILNPYRAQRGVPEPGCPLCGVVQEAKQNPVLNIDREAYAFDYLVTANKFPVSKGHAMAIHRGIGDEEKPFYTTINPQELEEQLLNICLFAENHHVKAFHNGVGAGSTIPKHEHWQFLDTEELFGLAGRAYGIENTETAELGNNASIMPAYPFAHMIFDQVDPERISGFLRRLQESIGNRYPQGFVPHVVAQCKNGIMIVPFAKFQERGIGAGDVAGHFVYRSEDEFNSADYDTCVRKLGETLYKKEELDLTASL